MSGSFTILTQCSQRRFESLLLLDTRWAAFHTEYLVDTTKSDIRVGELLEAVFGGQQGDLVVLRNAELLPRGLSGTDIDVSVLPGFSVSAVTGRIRDMAASVGWKPVIESRRPHMTALALVDVSHPSGRAIHFDIFDGLTALGVPTLTAETLATLTESRRGVLGLSKRGQVLATMVHHLAWNGCLGKRKYREELEILIAEEEERKWLEEQLASVLGSRAAVDVLSDVNALACEAASKRTRILLAVLLRSLGRHPVATLRQLLTYFMGQFRSLLVPPGLVGRLGDSIPALESRALDLEIACGLSPHGFYSPRARAGSQYLRTLNGPRYETELVRSWRRWTVLRWAFPSLFLAVQAKRGRVVVLDRLPMGLSVLRRVRSVRWVATQAPTA